MKALLISIILGILGLLYLGFWKGLTTTRTPRPLMPHVKMGRSLRNGESKSWSILGREAETEDWTFSGSYLLRTRHSHIWISGEIIDKAPNKLMQRLATWDGETANLPFRQFRGKEIAPDYNLFGKGLWLVGYCQLGDADPIAGYPCGEQPPKEGTVHLDFEGGPPNTCGIRVMWELRGPIQEPLYLPLKGLLTDCVLVPDPDHPNIKPKLNVPVIEGKGKNGKDIVVMKPLITKVVRSDGQPIQAFTGNPAEDKYLDKKFNQP